MDRHLFAKKRVSLAVSVALGAVAVAPVAAQQNETANDQVMEEVVVTGIRSSLKRAMDTKRDATGVVDAIASLLWSYTKVAILVRLAFLGDLTVAKSLPMKDKPQYFTA